MSQEHELFHTEIETPYLIHLDWLGVLSYAFSQSRLPLVYELKIFNNTTIDVEDFFVRITFDFDFIAPFEQKFSLLSAGQMITLTPDFRLYAKRLFEISESAVDTMTIYFETAAGDVLLQKTERLLILPINQWSGSDLFAESLASFVLPNIPQVVQLQGRVAQLLKELSGDSSITGYLTGDKNTARQQMAAIYATIYEQNINYNMLAASMEVRGQRVRTSDDVLSNKQGNCVEMSLLFASLCEACGLHPFIVLVRGHAFAGIWLDEQVFEENCVRDYAEINKRLAEGIHDIEVVECTTMNAGSDKSFEQAVRIARGCLEKAGDFVCVIDVFRSHHTGIRPMPVQIVEAGQVKIVDYGLAQDANEKGQTAKTLEEHFLDTSTKDQVSKSTIWMRNLLDLSKRNALLSFRPGQKSLQLFISDLATLEDALSKGEAFTIREQVDDWHTVSKKISFVDIETESELIGQISAAEFKSHRLRTFLPKEALAKRLLNLYREAKNSLEENGANTLYLALGFLRWFDPSDPVDAEGDIPARYAPLILLPIDLVRQARGTFQMTLRDEDAQFNITLLEMLRQNFDLHIGGLNPLPLDTYGVDIPLVFNSVRKAIMSQRGWDVVEMACLGLFSFSQFVMWNDLKSRFDRLTESKVVHSLVSGLYVHEEAADISGALLDKEVNVADVVVPSSVDSSQLAAILEAARGSSFVLHGPPGTGKSQTITNIIANAIYQGKSVIFVAEKMAALNVVQERLQAMGLGDYCLELHSNKTQKRVLLDKLEKNMALTPLQESAMFGQTAEQIQHIKEQLMTALEQLHVIKPYGRSIYDLVSIFVAQGGAARPFQFSQALLERLTAAEWNKWDASLRGLGQAMATLGVPYGQHPLQAWQKSGYTLKGSSEVADLLKRTAVSCAEIGDALVALSALSPMAQKMQDDVKHVQLLQALYQVCQARNLRDELTLSAIKCLQDPDTIHLLKQAVDVGQDHLTQQQEMMARYAQSIEAYDVVLGKGEFLRASNSFLLKGRQQKQALQDLNSRTRQGFEVTADNAMAEFDAITTYLEVKQAASERASSCRALLQVSPRSGHDEDDQLADLLALATVIQEMRTVEGISTEVLLACYHLAKDCDDAQAPHKSLPASYHRLTQLLAELEAIVGVSAEALLGAPRWLAQLGENIALWQQHFSEWKNWSAFYAYLEELAEAGLTCIVTGLSSAVMAEGSAEELLKMYYASLAHDLIQFELDQSPTLARFNGLTFEGRIDEYNRLIDELEKISQEQVRIRLSQNLPNARTAPPHEAKQLAALARIIRSKGRGISIRSIFEETNLVIKRLTPCLLMSPLSVAQYIDPSFPKFDLVIFDEASQIRTSVAIGTMSRAENCIIVGDPNQMPPTSFFASQNVDEDNLQLEDLESLLDDCLAINMPQRYLDWHYRSQSESLIAFSNQMYYGSRMKTFPSPFDRLSKVSLCKVAGIYDRGLTRTNRGEAEAIVAEIISRLYDPERVAESIGVITFNIAQQNLIDDLLQAEVNKSAELEQIMARLKEPIFIKNLENVQGDERDVVLFSICYGPDQEGKIALNFGPLNRKGGWRRLNVAVSRARKEMMIYTSMDPSEIKIRATSSEGLIGIRQFLEFAQRGQLDKFKSGTATTQARTDRDGAMVDVIATFLIAQGYQVEQNIGSSDLRLDLAVVDPRIEGHYLCAIRIDGKKYAQADTTRDRHRLVPAVLKVRGWHMYSLWTLDWYDDPQKEGARLLAYIQELVQLPPPKVQKRVQPKEPVGGHPEANQDVAPEMTSDQVRVHQDAVEELVAEPLVQDEQALLMYTQPYVVEPTPHQEALEAPGLGRCPATSNPCEMAYTTAGGIDASLPTIYVPYQHLRTWSNEALQEDEKETVVLMEAIVAQEAPIRDKDIFYRVLEAYPGARLTKNNEAYLQKCLAKLRNKKTTQGSDVFYWGKGGNPNDYHTYRLPAAGARRELETVSDYELANIFWAVALDHLAEDGVNIQIEEEEMIRQATRLLGFARCTEKMATLAQTAVTNGIRRKIFKREKKSLILGENGRVLP